MEAEIYPVGSTGLGTHTKPVGAILDFKSIAHLLSKKLSSTTHNQDEQKRRSYVVLAACTAIGGGDTYNDMASHLPLILTSVL